MKCLLVRHLINLFLLFEICSADIHKYGHKDLGGELFFFKQVIDQHDDVPKNYTIIFKYLMGSKISPMLSYFEIDVNVNSTADLKITNELKNIDATVSIYNAQNVNATISIYGFGMSLLPVLRGWPFNKEDTAAKSFTIVYMKNATARNENEFARNSIGTRQPGDSLIYFESRNVTNVSRFPSRAFEYSGDDSITYVGFSFNSPTAMAMVNTTYISEKEFNTVAYDMNTEHFVANMSIYGYKHGSTPTSYVNLIGQ